MNIEEIIKSGKGRVLDVRTRSEFAGGHVAGAVNIPLQELPQRTGELEQLQAPLVVCCASGARSGQAEAFLTRRGMQAVNGGSWLEVNYLTAEHDL